jgi:hypothetical protein
MPTVTAFLTTTYTRMLALVVIGVFALNGTVVAPMLIYGNPFWPSDCLLLARTLDIVFVVLAARRVWICAPRA